MKPLAGVAPTRQLNEWVGFSKTGISSRFMASTRDASEPLLGIKRPILYEAVT